MTILAALHAARDAAARAELYRSWHAAQRAGMSYDVALESLGKRPGSVEVLRRALLDARRNGTGIADAVRPLGGGVVEPFERAILALGEEAGALEKSLKSLADFFAGEHKALVRLQSKLTYPLLLSIVTVLLAPLPLLAAGRTRAYFAITVLGLVAWYVLGGVPVLALRRFHARRAGFLQSRLCRALVAAVEAGLPLDRAVMLAAEASGDEAILAHVKRLGTRAIATQPLEATFASCPGTTPAMLGAMRVARVTGDYAGSIGRLGALYEDGFR